MGNRGLSMVIRKLHDEIDECEVCGCYRGAPSSVPVVVSISIWLLTSSSTMMIFSFSAFRFNFFACDLVNPSAPRSRLASKGNGSTFHDCIHINSITRDSLQSLQLVGTR